MRGDVEYDTMRWTITAAAPWFGLDSRWATSNTFAQRTTILAIETIRMDVTETQLSPQDSVPGNWHWTDAAPGLWVMMLVAMLWLSIQSSRLPPSGMDENDRPAMVRICINDCDEAELQMLPTIGPNLARRILRYRDHHGRFASWDDVDAVPGIGPATIEAIRPWIDFQRNERVADDRRRPFSSRSGADRFDERRVAQSR